MIHVKWYHGGRSVWPNRIPSRPDWITHRFGTVAESARILATIHDLRRSFSALAQRAGVDRMTVKDLGGWSSVAMVDKHYTGEIEPIFERAMDQAHVLRRVA